MKKFKFVQYLILLLLFIFFVSVYPETNAGAQSSRMATVFSPKTGMRKAIKIGDPLAFAGGFMLETPNNNYIQYWVNRLTNADSKPITDEELNYIPEDAWYRVIPNIINEVPRGTGLLGSGEPQVTATVVCRGEDCLQYLEDPLLGYSVVTRYRTRLSSSMTSSQTTVPVSSVSTFDDTTLTIDLLGGKIFLSVEPGTSREEIIKCTAVSSTTWSSCTRGLAFSGTSESAVTANQKTHNAGSIVVMSNVHYVYEQLADKDTAETFSGIKTFSNYPLGPGTAPTSSSQLADKLYVDGVVNQGAATSSETIGGISELATQIENASSTPFDNNNTHVQNSEHSTSTPNPTVNPGLWDVWSENDGRISQNWIDKTEQLIWTGDFQTSSSTDTKLLITNATTTGTFNVDGNISLGVGNYIFPVSMPTTTAATSSFSGANITQTIFSRTIPADAMGNAGVIKLEIKGKLQVTSGTAYRFDVQYGGENMCSWSANTTAAPEFFANCWIIAQNSKTAQRASGIMWAGGNDYTWGTASQTVFSTTTDKTVNSAVAQTLAIIGRTGNNAGDHIDMTFAIPYVTKLTIP